MPQYLLLLRGAADADYARFDADELRRLMAVFDGWVEDLTAQGRLLGGHKLVQGEGVVLDPRDGALKNRDGPYQETKEVVGGYFVITADSYEHAVELCRGHPNHALGAEAEWMRCSIEIREVDDLPGAPE